MQRVRLQSRTFSQHRQHGGQLLRANNFSSGRSNQKGSYATDQTGWLNLLCGAETATAT